MNSEPRLRPPAELEVKVLGPLKEGGFFESKAHALLFAASLGMFLEKMVTPKAHGEGIKREYFDEEVRVIDILNIAALRRLDAISESNAKVSQEAFEAYACAGLEAIYEACFSGKRPPLEGLLDLMAGIGRPKSSLPSLI
jgi:dnd system-associated protein 4